jgi:hypothetical protein
MSLSKFCVSMFGAVALASVSLPAREAHATVVDTGDAYVCQVNIQPHGVDANAGNFGYLYIQLSTAPACGGTKYAGYLYTTGATYTGSEWRSNTLYSEAALMAIYLSFVEVAQSGKRAQMYVSTQTPHSQIYSTTLKGY